MSISKKLSVIIVNYNSTQYLKNLILSINKIDQIVQEIIIVDNHSKDIKDLQITNKKIKIIFNNDNRGFSKAVNQGIIISKSKYILLINPDCLIIDDSIVKSFEFLLKRKNIGAIGGKIQEMDSLNYQHTANSKPNFLTAIFEFTNIKKLFPNNIFSKNFWIENTFKSNIPIEVDAVCGAFVIFRKYINKKLNLFNESYFLYLEDLDFGLKIKSEGYQVFFDPNSTIKHLGGSSSNSKYNIVLKHWYKSRKIFFKKHLNVVESVILSIIFTLEECFLQIYHYIKNEPSE